jgi:hypothetical protein
MDALAVAKILGGLFAAWAAGWTVGVSVSWVRKLRNVA